MKLKIAIPTLVSGLVALVAGSLFFSTALRRHRTSEAVRLAALSSADSRMAPVSGGREMGAALPSFRTLPAGESRDSAIRERMKAAMSLGSHIDRTRALLALMRDFTTADFRAALDSYPMSMTGKRDAFFMTLFDEFRKRDPAAALNYAANAPGMEEIAGKLLFDSGVDAVVEWTKADPSGKRLNAVADRLIGENPALALEVLSQLPVDRWRQSLARMIQSNEGNSKAEVQKWFDALTDPAQRKAAETTILQFLGKDALKPGGLAGREAPPEYGRSLNMIGRWLAEEPAAAREAVAQLPAGSTRRRAVEIVLADAFQHSENPMEVIRQFSADLDAEMRTGALRELAYRDSALALQSSGTLIKDVAERETVDAMTLAIWAGYDESAARKWMDDHQVSENVRTQADQEIERDKQLIKKEFIESEQAKATGR